MPHLARLRVRLVLLVLLTVLPALGVTCLVVWRTRWQPATAVAQDASRMVQLAATEPSALTHRDWARGEYPVNRITGKTILGLDWFTRGFDATEFVKVELDRTLVLTLLGFGLAILFALIAVWVGRKRFLLRRVRALREATQRIAAGEWSARTSMPHPNDELGRLAHAIDLMATALESTTTLLEKVWASLDQAVLVIDPATHTILTCNSAVERVFGYRPAEVLERTPAFLHVNPEHSASFGRAYVAALDQDGVYQTAYPLRRKDGTTFFAEITLNEIVDHAGWRTKIVYVVRDLTERKQMERELKNRNDDLLALNKLATVIGAAFNLNDLLNHTLALVLDLLRLQVGAIHLYDAEQETLTLAVQRGLAPAMRAEIQQMPVGTSMLGRAVQSERAIILAPGTDGVYLGAEFRDAALYPCLLAPLRAKDKPNGVLTLFGCGARTLTVQGAEFITAVGNQLGVAVEHIRLAAKAEEADLLTEVDRLRSELIANVSHELRTPLGLIKLYSTTLLAEDVEFSRDMHREFLNNINHETDRLEKIVDNLLDGLRLQAKELRLDKRETDLDELARHVVAALQPQFAPHPIVCRTPAHLIASVDAKRIEHVLRNLLLNAVQYSPHGGTITVEGRREETHVLMQVSDQGVGIPLADLERVFARFYRAASDLAFRVGGVGLGLAICRGIVEAHGGKIWVTSTVNHGSTFYFTLPVK